MDEHALAGNGDERRIAVEGRGDANAQEYNVVWIEDEALAALQGEKGYSTYERSWSRPTCDVNGLTSGYQGEGAKTIIPSFASCKITMRLVPEQEPMDICTKLEKFLQKIAPKSVRVKVDKHGGAKAVVVPQEGPWLDAAAREVPGQPRARRRQDEHGARHRDTDPTHCASPAPTCASGRNTSSRSLSTRA